MERPERHQAASGHEAMPGGTNTASASTDRALHRARDSESGTPR